MFAALVVVAASLAIWICAARTRRDADEALGLLHAKRAALVKEIGEAERPRSAVERVPAPAAKLPTAGMVATSPPSVLQKEPSPPNRVLADAMASDPKVQMLWLQRTRAKAVLAYDEFFHRQNLSPSQIERFLENKMRFEELDLDLENATAGGDAAGKNAAKTLRQRGKADYETAQQAAIGREDYEALLEYDRTAWVRNVVVNALAGGAAVAGVPLTAEQGARLLVAALAATGNDSAARGEQLVREIDWEMLDAQAQRVLTPEQFAFFRNAAPPTGYRSRWDYQIAAAVARAQEAEGEKSPSKPSQ